MDAPAQETHLPNCNPPGTHPARQPPAKGSAAARRRAPHTEPRVQPGVSDSMGRRLYVGNLPYSATEDQLTELFGQAGKVDNVRVMRDMATGRARGFDFVA